MNDDRLRERIARNNATFRSANEKIHDKALDYDAPMERIPFLCECASPDCSEIVRLTMAEYEAVREDSRHFLTVLGHEGVELPVARVVSREDHYLVVEKDIGDHAR